MKYFIVLFFFTLLCNACNNNVNKKKTESKKQENKNKNKFTSKKVGIKFTDVKENLKIFEGMN